MAKFYYWSNFAFINRRRRTIRISRGNWPGLAMSM